MRQQSGCQKQRRKLSAKTGFNRPDLMRTHVQVNAAGSPLSRMLHPAALFLLAFALFFAACRPGQPQWEPTAKLPDGVLDREAMIAVLVDVHLAEGDLLERNLPSEEQEALLRSHYEPLLARHGISARQLMDSYAYYVERPLTLNAMYEEVIEALNRIQAQVQAQVQEETQTQARPAAQGRSETPAASPSETQTPRPAEAP